MADATPPKPITGYCDPLSVAPGETVHFRVSCYESGTYRADIVRTISGDPTPVGGGYREDVLDASVNGEYTGRRQEIAVGSYAVVPDLPALSSFTLCVHLWPTTPEKGRQGVVRVGSLEGACPLELRIGEAGDLVLEIAGIEVATGVALEARRWVAVHASYDGETGRARLSAEPLCDSPGSVVSARPALVERSLEPGLLALPGGEPLYLADRRFNGRLEAPRLLSAAFDAEAIAGLDANAACVVGWWDFARDISSERVSDRSPNARHGETVNLPTRAVPGHAWTGQVQCWEQAPEQYAAIHFHDDDLADAGWQADFEWRVPAGTRSGIYAARLRLGDAVDHVQFFVRPPRSRPTADVLFLVPTASYLAYANHKVHLAGTITTVPERLTPNDATLLAHPEFGLSLYDYHSDGSGVTISSAQRPIMNLKSLNAPWAFVSDTRLTGWLEHAGYRYDVLTDGDLHREGPEMLERYRVVLTGTHPEYYSTAMLDAVDGYLGRGGRLMYMGGNGFYWRIAFHPTRPDVIEVRRAEGGTRAWLAEPGESYHAWGGEYGGLWRRIGRAPNRLVGVGFAAQGFDRGTYYRRTPESLDPRVAFMWNGIDAEVIGDHGRFDSASGEEIDRFDARLGSPAHALVVATSENHSKAMLRTVEEFHMSVPHREDPEIRSDLVFFECPEGGAVFSTGSIAWANALATDGYDNHVERLTRNVLDRFLDPTGFLAG